MSGEIVKVQMGFLSGLPVPGRAVVYDKVRAHIGDHSLPPEVSSAMVPDTVAFFSG